MKNDTKLVHLGRGPSSFEGTVNLPVYRASTILSTDMDSYIHRFDDEKTFTDITYGARGTQNARALGEAVAALEGGYGTVVTASGLSAISVALGALVSAGDHILISDSVYGPTRTFCNQVLSRYGITTEYYAPDIGGAIAELIRKNTRLVFMEAPGSLTFEMQDIPGITRATKEKGVLTLMDNTWATPIFFRPLEHGVDVSIQAGTKYIAGHSDLVIGMITSSREVTHRMMVSHAHNLGDAASPDDSFMALRGLRTLSVRLYRQQESAFKVASWLVEQPQVYRVLYPALAGDPGHALWKRDFTGASSLFGLAIHSEDETAVKAMVDSLQYFQIGSSWGGYESLIAFNHMPVTRDRAPWTEKPFMLRVHIGLEDVEDLIADLTQGLARI
ncbi:MAG TPA: cystathionine beta-lyase [Gammaproteobacteria bacterium]|jgi:cystathionine beta-lyase|nr:cystathionine beta-lyase [Gammaproteobacteria bacterium]HIM88197.1 cystathionine beta-lyase [Gammaproteobacteria bacterium]HIP06183.1 cystathionine beta-lyase [Gammaproteobacteria bacterium]|tara:strand:+ start:214 stop:1377 length:1164 start_codon:yes stop_codon:yes gene_type:complete